MANEQQNNDPNDDFVGSIVHTYPVSGGNTLPHAAEMTRIMLPAIQRCWDLLSVEEREPNRFTEYMVITVVFATKAFLAQQSNKPQNSSDANG